MKFIADLHIHSHFSRATSRDLVPEDLSFWAQRKGIAVIGTGDFTHPGWIAELRDKLVEAESGLYRLKPDLEKRVEGSLPPSCRAATRFILSGEISCIYKREGKTRKVHNLILMPDFEAVDRLNDRLGRVGNLRSDGRPILGLDSRDLLEIVLSVSDHSFFIPAHIWTPWFSLFGSKSGFDLIEECFADLTPHIHALETGLSSDPPMNRRLSALDPYLLVSNSDAHSSAKLGREANIFNTTFDYDHMLEAMIHKVGFEGTIEFFPEEGKYHLDGHRKCGVKLHPSQTREYDGLCPKCGKPLTVGVLHRVYELSDRESPPALLPFSSLIPLSEILSEIYDCGPASKKVTAIYADLLARLGPEIHILLNAPLEEIVPAGGPLLAEAVQRMRHNKVLSDEGYDGEYGVIRLFDELEKKTLSGQTALFRLPERRPQEAIRELPFEKKDGKKTEKKEPFQAHLFDPILSPLNDEQRQAVLFQSGHILILAGPGTGKTLTLTHRLAYQIHSGQVRPEQILALTFTNKAAREMRKRLTALIPQARICATTFHAFCLDVLKENQVNLNLPEGLTICSEADASLLARQVLAESGKSSRTLAGFLKELPFLKRGAVLSRDVQDPSGDLHGLFNRYQQRLRSLGMLDLDDLEVETLRLFRNHPEVALSYSTRFPKIFVDEYQDTNSIQLEILKSLVHAGLSPLPRVDPLGQSPGLPLRRPSPVQLCAIGDPDQAIYGFRGADVRNFFRYAEDFPGAREFTLSLNYRSTQLILDAAAKVVKKIGALRATHAEGHPVAVSTCKTQAEEAEMVVEQIERMIGGTTYFSLDSGRVMSHEEGENLGFGDMALLFRLNSQADAFEESLSRAGIPYVRSGEKPLISRYPVDVLWRFLQTVLHPENGYYREAYRQILKHHAVPSHPPLTPPIKGGELNPVVSSPSIEEDHLQFSSPSIAEDRPQFSSPSIAEDRPQFSSPSIAEDSPQFSSPLMGEDKGGGGKDILQLIDQAIALHGFTSLSEEEEDCLRRLKDLAKGPNADLPSFLDALCLDRGIDHENLLGDRVALMSLHAAKGLEWPVVFIAGCEDGLLPCTLFGDRDDEEEKRLFYVGITRACRRLILSHARRPSPFLELIPGNLLVPLERTAWKPKKAHRQLGLF
jgi:DNA helicase-2/ATP-dependent DNA helicase PcrA